MIYLDTTVEEDETDMNVGGSAQSMRCDLERVNVFVEIAIEGSIAELCETRAMMEDRVQQMRVKELLMRNLQKGAEKRCNFN